jgi:hypothetical protein
VAKIIHDVIAVCLAVIPRANSAIPASSMIQRLAENERPPAGFDASRPTITGVELTRIIRVADVKRHFLAS